MKTLTMKQMTAVNGGITGAQVAECNPDYVEAGLQDIGWGWFKVIVTKHVNHDPDCVGVGQIKP